MLADGVVVVGAGLIGTSVGPGPPSQRGACAPGGHRCPTCRAGRRPRSGFCEVALSAPALVVVCVPPDPVATSHSGALQRRYLHASVTDVASVKSHVQRDIETLGADLGRFVGGHPMAGRERSGAAVARADLFEGRPWVLSPSRATSALTRERCRGGRRAVRRRRGRRRPRRHDDAVALVSHAPQVVASRWPRVCADAEERPRGPGWAGVRDVTRIAASDAALWTEILSANASAGAAGARRAADRTWSRTALSLRARREGRFGTESVVGKALSRQSRDTTGQRPSVTDSPRAWRARVAAGCRASTGPARPPTPRCRSSSPISRVSWPACSPLRTGRASTSRT